MIYDRAMESLKSASEVLGFDATEVEQNSPEWLYMRLGVLTASNADKIIAGTKTASRRSYIASLIKEVMTCEIAEQLPFKQLEHGNLYEPIARESLSLALMEDVKEIPFIYKDDSMRVGMSPDGVAGSKTVELKCPYDSAVFIKFMCFDDIKKEYHKQQQFQMWVAGAEGGYFGNYDPRMKLCKELHFAEVERDEAMMKTFDDAVPQFICDMDSVLESLGVKFGDHWKYIRENIFQGE